MYYIIAPTNLDIKHGDWKNHKYKTKSKKNGKWIYDYDILKDTINRIKSVNSPQINSNRGTASEALIDLETHNRNSKNIELGKKVKDVRDAKAITNPNYNWKAPSEYGRAKRAAEKEMLGNTPENIRKIKATDNSIDSIAKVTGIFDKVDSLRKQGFSSDEILDRLTDEEAATLLSVFKNSNR